MALNLLNDLIESLQPKGESSLLHSALTASFAAFQSLNRNASSMRQDHQHQLVDLWSKLYSTALLVEKDEARERYHVFTRLSEVLAGLSQLSLVSESSTPEIENARKCLASAAPSIKGMRELAVERLDFV